MSAKTEAYETVQIPKATADFIKKHEFFKLFNSVDEFVMEAVRRQLIELQLTQKNQTLESKKEIDLSMVTLQIELAKPFVDFIEDYRKYFGAEASTELICMSMIYSQVKRLFNELDGFTRQKSSFLDKSDFFKKYFYLGTVSREDPEDETE